MAWFRIARALVLGTLIVGVAAYAVVPVHDLGQQVLYDAVAGLAILAAFGSVAYYRPRRPGGWLLVISGMGVWVLGDMVWSYEQYGLDQDRFPASSDAFYIAGYALLAIGVVLMVRTRRASRDVTALLDSLIVAAGVGVCVTTFVIAPLADDSTLSMAAKLVSTYYPLADLMLFAVLARIWTIPGARTLSCVLLTASIGLTLTVDLTWNIWLVATDSATDAGGHLADVAWLSSYVLVAAAASTRSMHSLAEPLPEQEESVPSGRRLAALAVGLMLPAIALLVDGALGTLSDLWPVVGVGMLILTALILVRMSGLLTIVESQATRLAAVARSDPLTGAPNRGTWDHELARACATSREEGTPLAVGMLDLDEFKLYNDTHGHPAGDRLLREAVAAWSDAIADAGMLARYGGEEFAVLLPRTPLTEAVRTLDALRELTPSGQTFSAGVCLWDPSTDPGTAVAWADDALYRAKRTGKDRVVAHPGAIGAHDGLSELPHFTMVVQPIFEIASRRVVAHEALSRFHGTDDDVQEVFNRAHAHGYGDLLEASAIESAVNLEGRPEHQDLYVNASPTALASDRFWATLPARLDGIVVEIGELRSGVTESVLVDAVDRLRARGARIALDDIGSRDGNREFARLALLQPDVVKIDRSIVSGCAVDPRRSAVLAALSTYATTLGVTVCAEGVETEEDLRCVASLGVPFAQGFLLAEPDERWLSGVDSTVDLSGR